MYIGPEMLRVIRYIRLYEKGLGPVAGGVLDQAHWFIKACEFFWSEQA